MGNTSGAIFRRPRTKVAREADGRIIPMRAPVVPETPAPTSSGPGDPDTPEAWNAGTWRLVLMVTLPFWAYLALMRIVVFQLINAGNPGIIIAPPYLRLLQHAFLLPFLLVFYRVAISIGWSSRTWIRGVLIHTAMAVLFATLARPILLVLVAGQRGEWSLLGELLHSVFG